MNDMDRLFALNGDLFNGATSPQKYAEFVRIGNFTKSDQDAKFLAAMGLCGEAGEVSELLKKHLLHGKPLNRDALREELGDVLWYLFHALNTFDMTFEEVARENIDKLCKRYPYQYGHPSNWY